MTDYAANLALFLLDNVGTIHGRWSGRMSAKEQRELFGRFLGKGRVIIDGHAEMVSHVRKVCFGLDYDVTANIAWRNLNG